MERIAGQIERFQEEFQTLSKAATLHDLARSFCDLLKENFPPSRIRLHHKRADQETWSELHSHNTADYSGVELSAFAEITSRCYLDDSRTQLTAFQKLSDSSSLAIQVTTGAVTSKFEETDRVSLQFLVQLFSGAYQAMLHRRNEKHLVFSLNHRVLQLNSLIDTGIEVSKLKQERSLQQLALERAASLTNASRGLLTVSREGRETERYAFPTAIVPGDGVDDTRRIDSSFEYNGATYTFELFEKESRRGPIPFDETDRMLLDALARQVHASLENRYLLQEAIEKQRTDQEISVAASIQQRILPRSLPSIEGFDISGINIASKSVGGDYYDCVPLSDGNFALVMADVAGKGIPAGLLVSSFHAYLNAYLESRISVVQLAQRLNRAICKASTDDKFITAFLALLNPKTGELESLSAGHNPVYLVKNDRTIQELNAGGVALGMLDIEFPYQTETSVIEKGESLLLYTDGVTEAIDEQDRLYDAISPLKKFTLDNLSHSAETFIQRLISDIRRFAGAAPQVDDITALYLRRL